MDTLERILVLQSALVAHDTWKTSVGKASEARRETEAKLSTTDSRLTKSLEANFVMISRNTVCVSELVLFLCSFRSKLGAREPLTSQITTKNGWIPLEHLACK